MTMKILVYLTLTVLLAMILCGCAKATPKGSEGMINPGDNIGNFLITTGDKEGVTYTSLIHCPESGDKQTCELTVGTKVNVSWGIYGDTNSGKDLDTVWSEHTYEMVIEGRPVNLQAFGSIDITHPVIGKMRNWNVVIVTDKPGEITIQDSGVAGGDAFSGTTVLIFSTP
jgi:hypothetical protein